MSGLRAFHSSPLRPFTLRHPSSRDQLDDQHDQRDHQQKVNKAAGDLKAEAERPHDKKNDKDGPEHGFEWLLTMGSQARTALAVSAS